jgi:hypothetical protein
MSYVQSATTGSTVITTGGAGASLTGVTAGHGLVLFVYVDSTTVITGVADSNSGNTWSQALKVTDTANSEYVAIYTPNQAVLAGTHTLSVTGPSSITILVEDTNATYGTAQGQNQVAPGAGTSLTTGTAVGSSGNSVIAFSSDNTNGTPAGYEPTVGSGGYTSRQTNFNSIIGAYLVATNDTGGGSTAKFAVGSSDSTGADGYLTVAIPLSGSGGGGISLAWIT